MSTALDRPPMTHELKCHPEPFQAVKRGEKTFEYRKDDRDYRVGDTLWLREWDLTRIAAREFNGRSSFEAELQGYTGERVHRTVTYIIREGYGIPEGYCIMSIASLPIEGGEPVAATMDDVLEITALAIGGLADSAIVGNGPYNVKHTIAVVKQLAEEHKRLRASPRAEEGKLTDKEHLDRLSKALGKLAPRGYWFANLLEAIYHADTIEDAVNIAVEARKHIDKSLMNGPTDLATKEE